MPTIHVKFCGKPLNTEDLDLIKELAAEFWGISRSELASTICELLGWRRQNGKLKTVECGHFLLDLAEQEIIMVPRRGGKGRLASNVKHGVATIDQDEIHCSLRQLRPIHLEKEERATLQKWKELVDAQCVTRGEKGGEKGHPFL